MGVGVGARPAAAPALGGTVSGYKRLSWGIPVVVGGISVQREQGALGEVEGGDGEGGEKEGEGDGEGEKTAVGSPAG